MKLYGPLNSGDSTGGVGVSTATANSTVPLKGRIQGIYIKYNGSPPAGTCDATVATVGTSPAPPSYVLASKANSATDAWHYPRVLVQDTVGADIAGEYTPQLVHDFVKVTIAQANDADSIDVWFLLDDYSTEQ